MKRRIIALLTVLGLAFSGAAVLPEGIVSDWGNMFVAQAVDSGICGDKSAKALVTVTAPTSAFDITVENCYYSPTNKAQVYKPKVTVEAGGKILKENVDYTVEYTGTTSKSFSITAKALSDSDVTVSAIPRQQATGSAITPVPKLTYEGVALVKDVDYILKYSNNNVVSTENTKASIKIQGKGNYNQSTIVTFDIYCQHPCANILNGKCTICNTVVDAKTKLSHDYRETKVAPTYDTEGYTMYGVLCYI